MLFGSNKFLFMGGHSCGGRGSFKTVSCLWGIRKQMSQIRKIARTTRDFINERSLSSSDL